MLITNFHLKFALYKLVEAGFQLFDIGYMHPMRERNKRALMHSVDYIDTHMGEALGFANQRALMHFAIHQVEVGGVFTEFGVYKGGTIRFMAKELPNHQFHGFDSFEGLPEAWGGFDLARGAFSLEGKMPRVQRNVQLHKGYFDTTLAMWKETHSDKIAFMHIDCDLYSSTHTVLEELFGRLQVGTVILFDEYFNYPGWERHEFRAWQEFVASKHISYRYLGYARQQAAVEITGIGA